MTRLNQRFLKIGREERSIACDVLADYNRDQIVYVESEWPHREIQRRPLTDKDRQLPLFSVNTPQAASQEEESAAPEADDGKSCETCKHAHDGEEQFCMRDYDNECNNFSAWEEAEDEPEAEVERSCGTCARIHETPESDESSPCTACGQNSDLPNWTDEYHVPADDQDPQPAAMQ